MKFGLKENVIQRIQNIFAAFPQVDEAVLYGSRAKGNYRPGSDIDLTLKGEELNLSVLNKISSQLDDLLLPYTFDLSIYRSIDNLELIDHISRVGVSFYRKNMKNILGKVSLNFITVILFLGLFLIGLFLARHRVVWNDEIFTQVWSVSELKYQHILLGHMPEGNVTPAYYFTQKLLYDLLRYKIPHQWRTDMGYEDPPSRIFVRLHSNIFMSLSVCVIFYFFVRMCSWGAGAYSVLVSLSSYMLWAYWAEGRPYALWFFVTTVHSLLLVRAMTRDQMTPGDWRAMIVTHIVLAMTAVFSIVQITMASFFLWLMKDRSGRRQILLTIVPWILCVYYYAQAPGYKFWFADGPVELVCANIPKDRFMLFFIFAVFGGIYLFYRKQSFKTLKSLWDFFVGRPASLIKEDLGRTSPGKQIDNSSNDFMKAGIMFLLWMLGILGATALVLLKFKLAEDPNHAGFQISSRYFVFLAPIGIIAATLFSVGMFRALKGKIALRVLLVLVVGILLLFRFHRTFELVYGYYHF